MAVRVAGLAFGGRAEHRGDVVLAFDVGLAREIQVTAIRLRFAGERGLEIVVRLGALEFHLLLLMWICWPNARAAVTTPRTTGRICARRCPYVQLIVSMFVDSFCNRLAPASLIPRPGRQRLSNQPTVDHEVTQCRLPTPRSTRSSAPPARYRAWRDRAGLRRNAARDLRPDEVGPDLVQLLSGAHRFRHDARGQGAARAALDDGNVGKTMAAPATAIVAYDLEFYEKLPLLAPHADARSGFVGKPELIRDHGVSQRLAAGRLPDHRGARARPRLRTDVGLRQCEGRRRVLSRRNDQVELPVQPRLRRSGEAPAARAAARVRRRRAGSSECRGDAPRTAAA